MVLSPRLLVELLAEVGEWQGWTPMRVPVNLTVAITGGPKVIGISGAGSIPGWRGVDVSSSLVT